MSERSGTYKDTILTPRTEFPMRANLKVREPTQQQAWAEGDIYGRIRAAREGRPRFLLHDGPPYANGDIHMGHLLNKVLKDIVVKSRSMAGFDCSYLPGWDCHGLPIEQKVLDELGAEAAHLSPMEIRKRCAEYANHYVGVQAEQFQRLSIFGEFDRPYLTMSPAYEREVIGVFADLVAAGLVYKQLKTVAWSVGCQTALADAELEYQDVEGPSIHVNFPVATESVGAFAAHFGEVPAGATATLMIWTTTPWTLQANMAIAVHPDLEYVAVRYARDGREWVSVVADVLVDRVMAAGGIGDFERLGTARGATLTDLTYRHVWLDKTLRVVTADYVTTEEGTGLVHTAPGHGAEDYITGVREGIEIYCPVTDEGRYDPSVPDWLDGLHVYDADQAVLDRLVADGWMFAAGTLVHSYPHCWRSKTPVVFRATEQWFVAVDRPFAVRGDAPRSLRQRALDACRPGADGAIAFMPDWGRNRLIGMLESRPDWCIRRQRAWGLPIPVFYNPAGEPLMTPQTVRRVADYFGQHGSDRWFTDSPADILGDLPLPDGFDAETLRKETDILDVWFESGSSWRAVCQARELGFPVDLYLEGSDQHRGWFQLSLLPGLGAEGRPPFEAVLTHGFVVDEHGYKMSKSAGNVVSATEAVDRYGADVMRLWVASVDYQGDIKTSYNLIASLQDAYRKVRNTIRFALGAIADFDPSRHRVAVDGGIDAWARMELHRLIGEVRRYYDTYAFYRIFRIMHDFCAVEMSSVYFTAIKDRLYCDAADSPRRRRTQTVLWELAAALIRLIAPILPHTADEAWSHLAARPEDVDSVHLAHLPEPDPDAGSAELAARWERLLALRQLGMMELDRVKTQQGLKNPLDAEVVYVVPAADKELLAEFDDELADLLGAGCHRVRIEDGKPRVEVVDARDTYPRCARSWKRRPDVGSDPAWGDLSARDAAVMRGLRG